MTTEAVTLIAGYLVLINFWTYKMFALDKYSAENGLWRISEQSLLLLAFVGGSAGALTGQRVLRHKTRKQPFRTLLNLIAALQVVAIAALSVPEVRAEISALLR